MLVRLLALGVVCKTTGPVTEKLGFSRGIGVARDGPAGAEPRSRRRCLSYHL